MGLAFQLFPTRVAPLSQINQQYQTITTELKYCQPFSDEPINFFNIQEEIEIKTLIILPILKIKKTPFRRDKHIKQLVQPCNWIQLFQQQKIVIFIFDYLSAEDLIILKQTSRGLKRRVIEYILQNYNNWSITLTALQPYLSQQTILKQSGCQSQYQHSEDLDRTSGYFQQNNMDGLTEQQLKLDRIITTISFKIKYFQGIMPICVSLLQFFNQDMTYWLLRYLLAKCRYLQIELQIYFDLIRRLQIEFKYLLPQLNIHFKQLGFDLDYFVMKWVMGLFSQDVDRNMLLAIWDLLCQTDYNILIYLIIQIFVSLQHQLLQKNQEQVNYLLKNNLKLSLSSIDLQNFINSTKVNYIRRYLRTKYI